MLEKKKQLTERQRYSKGTKAVNPKQKGPNALEVKSKKKQVAQSSNDEVDSLAGSKGTVEPAVAGVKRRGRPKKIITNDVANAENRETVVAEEALVVHLEPPKAVVKKRGRPKKDNLVDILHRQP